MSDLPDGLLTCKACGLTHNDHNPAHKIECAKAEYMREIDLAEWVERHLIADSHRSFQGTTSIDNRPSFIPMAHEGSEMIPDAEYPSELNMPREVIKTHEAKILASGTSEHDSWFVATVKEGHASDYDEPPDKHSLEADVRVSSGWVCIAHPPGSEVEVRKGESCYCGRSE